MAADHPCQPVGGGGQVTAARPVPDWRPRSNRADGMRNRTKIAVSSARVRAWALALLVAIWAGPSGAARADTFVLRSGEPIDGSIVQATRNTLIIRRAIGGMHQMPIRGIEEVRIDLAQGEQISGQLLGWADGVYQIRFGRRGGPHRRGPHPEPRAARGSALTNPTAAASRGAAGRDGSSTTSRRPDHRRNGSCRQRRGAQGRGRRGAESRKRQPDRGARGVGRPCRGGRRRRGLQNRALAARGTDDRA